MLRSRRNWRQAWTPIGVPSSPATRRKAPSTGAWRRPPTFGRPAISAILPRTGDWTGAKRRACAAATAVFGSAGRQRERVDLLPRLHATGEQRERRTGEDRLGAVPVVHAQEGVLRRLEQRLHLVGACREGARELPAGPELGLGDGPARDRERRGGTDALVAVLQGERQRHVLVAGEEPERQEVGDVGLGGGRQREGLPVRGPGGGELHPADLADREGGGGGDGAERVRERPDERGVPGDEVLDGLLGPDARPLPGEPPPPRGLGAVERAQGHRREHAPPRVRTLLRQGLDQRPDRGPEVLAGAVALPEQGEGQHRVAHERLVGPGLDARHERGDGQDAEPPRERVAGRDDLRDVAERGVDQLLDVRRGLGVRLGEEHQGRGRLRLVRARRRPEEPAARQRRGERGAAEAAAGAAGPTRRGRAAPPSRAEGRSRRLEPVGDVRPPLRLEPLVVDAVRGLQRVLLGLRRGPSSRRRRPSTSRGRGRSGSRPGSST